MQSLERDLERKVTQSNAGESKVGGEFSVKRSTSCIPRPDWMVSCHELETLISYQIFVEYEPIRMVMPSGELASVSIHSFSA